MHDYEKHARRSAIAFLTFAAILLGFTMIGQAIAQVVGGAEVAAPHVLSQAASKIGWLGGLMAIALQLAKSDLLGGWFAKIDPSYQPAVVLLLGQIGGLIEAISMGKPFGQAALEWLLVSGNAMALYAVAVKPFTKKKPKVG